MKIFRVVGDYDFVVHYLVKDCETYICEADLELRNKQYGKSSLAGLSVEVQEKLRFISMKEVKKRYPHETDLLHYANSATQDLAMTAFMDFKYPKPSIPFVVNDNMIEIVE